jgi:predicted DNA-binding transcriptional regulator AlpA
MLETAVREEARRAVADLLGVDGYPDVELLALKTREMLLRADVVARICGVSIPTLYREVKLGSFPAPVKVTKHASAWKLTEILAWIDTRPRLPGHEAIASAA